MPAVNTSAIAVANAPFVLRVGAAFSGQAQYTSIQAAITAAAASTPAPSTSAPYTIEIYPGVYSEAPTFVANVHIKGIGPLGAVVIQQTDATIATLASMNIENVIFRLVTPTNARNMIIDNGAAVTCNIRHCEFDITTPSTFAHQVVLLSAASTVTFDDCYSTIAGTGASKILSVTGAAQVTIGNCDFNNNSTSATCATISCAFTGAFIAISDSDVYALYGNSFACSAGIIFLQAGVHYHALARSSTGIIMDHSEFIDEYVWHTFNLMWEIVNANANVNRRTGVGGTITDGGTGQTVLGTTVSATSVAGVENNNDPAGSVPTTFNPARGARDLIQFGADVFQANNSMFFGLRSTLGGVIPTTENHAGFEWDGTNFKCTNADGATQVTTNLATPSTGVQHQLEIAYYGANYIEFYVDGKLVHTEATHLPTGELQWQRINAGTGIALAATNVSLRRTSCRESPV